MLFPLLNCICECLPAMNRTTSSFVGLSIDIKYNIINIFLTSKLSNKVIRSFILDLVLIAQRRRLPSPTHSWLYLNYNDARCKRMARYHASKTNILTPTPKVSITSHSSLCEVRKKIQNYSFVLSDRIGKGYSSVVYRGLNDLTGRFWSM